MFTGILKSFQATLAAPEESHPEPLWKFTLTKFGPTKRQDWCSKHDHK